MDVKTARRTVELFEAFARVQTPLSLAELGRELDMPSSSCFNLVGALQNRGYLYSIGTRRRIYPTRKLFEVGSLIVTREPVVASVEELLTGLRDKTRETVIFGARQGEMAIYLSVIEGPQTIRYTGHAGDLKPLHSSAAGKALLSTLPKAELDKLVAGLKLEKMTDNTIVDLDALRANLALAETRGYAETRGENVADVMAIAMPIRIDGSVYALVVAGPMQRFDANFKQNLEALRETHAQILAVSARGGPF